MCSDITFDTDDLRSDQIDLEVALAALQAAGDDVETGAAPAAHASSS